MHKQYQFYIIYKQYYSYIHIFPRWYRETPGGVLREIREGEGGGRYSISSDALTIRRAELSDDGRWACRSANAHGHVTLRLHLALRAHLTVHAQPHTQVSF